MGVSRSGLQNCYSISRDYCTIRISQIDSDSRVFVDSQNRLFTELTLRNIPPNFNVNMTSKTGETPLHWACFYGYEELAASLLQKAADANYRNNRGQTPLHCACSEHSSLQIVQMLMPFVENVNVADNQGFSALHHACLCDKSTVIEFFLSKMSMDVSARDEDGSSPLHIACLYNSLASAALLLKYRADANAEDQIGFTPLMCACYSKNFKLIKLLLEYGVDVLRTDKFGCSAFHYACLLGRTRMCKVFLAMREDMDPNRANESGYAPAHLACYNGCVRVVKCLLAARDSSGDPSVDFNLKDKLGITPLMYAALNGHKEIVDMLLGELVRCDLFLKDASGNTLLHFVVSEDSRHIISTILRANSSLLNIPNNENLTPVNLACARNHLHSVEKLLRCGADLNIASIDGFTPLHTAVMNGNSELVSLLMSSDRVLVHLRTKLNLSAWDFAEQLPLGRPRGIILAALEKKTLTNQKLAAVLATHLPDMSLSDVESLARRLAHHGMVDSRDLSLLSSSELDAFLLTEVCVHDVKVREMLCSLQTSLVSSAAGHGHGHPHLGQTSAVQRLSQQPTSQRSFINRIMQGRSFRQPNAMQQGATVELNEVKDLSRNDTDQATVMLDISPATFDPLAASKRVTVTSPNSLALGFGMTSFTERIIAPTAASESNRFSDENDEDDEENSPSLSH